MQTLEKHLKQWANDPAHLVAAVIFDAAAAIVFRLGEINQTLKEKGANIVSELDDLQKAVDSLTTAVSSAGAELTKLAAEVKALSSASSIDPAQVEAAAQRIQAQADALSGAVAAAEPPPAAATT
jgi:peptidoglycan hydrolase CwlO-like protein